MNNPKEPECVSEPRLLQYSENSSSDIIPFTFIQGIQDSLKNDPMFKYPEQDKGALQVTLKSEQPFSFQDLNSQVSPIKSYSSCFNHYDVKLEEKSNQPKRKKTRGGARYPRAQNLKTISHHIIKLVFKNKGLTIKLLSYLLYQIMGNTNIGQKIIFTKYQSIQAELISFLTSKYRAENTFEEQMQPVIRNVRRRLYDALNVMIAANIIRKTIHQQIYFKFPKIKLEDTTSEMLEEELERQNKLINLDQFEKMMIKMSAIKKRVEKKKKTLKRTSQKLLLLRKHQHKNKIILERKPSTQFFKLPLLVIEINEMMMLQMQKQVIHIHSQKKLKYLSDIDCLEVLYQRILVERKNELKTSKI